MPTEFFAYPIGSPESNRIAKQMSTRNPFRTEAYALAMQDMGYEAWIVGASCESTEDAAFAFLRRGRLNRFLEIPSLPGAAASAAFWDGLFAFCRQQNVTMLETNSFGSESPVEIPAVKPDMTRELQMEYIIQLDGLRRLSRNHRRNLQKASPANLTLRRASSEAACDEHVRLMSQSRDRRVKRGEIVAMDLNPEHYGPLLKHGAGELFQVSHQGITVSSMLVLRSKEAAYFYSSGTSASGMQVGASHFLFQTIFEELKREGVRIVNRCGPRLKVGLFQRGLRSRDGPGFFGKVLHWSGVA